MRLPLNCTAALKHPGGVAFGEALWLEGDRIGLAVDGILPLDRPSELRLELDGQRDTLYLQVHPDSSEAQPDGRHVVSGRLRGHTAADLSRLQDSARIPAPTVPAYRFAESTDDDDGLDWLNPSPSVVSDGPPSSVVNPASAPAAPAAPLPTEPVPAPPPVPAPAVAPPPLPAPAVAAPVRVAPPEPAPAPEPATPPTCAVDFGRSTVTVRWADRRAFQASWHAELQRRSLVVPADAGQTPYLHQPFTVVLEVPQARAVTVRAGVLSRSAEGFTLGLELTDFLFRQLAALGGPDIDGARPAPATVEDPGPGHTVTFATPAALQAAIDDGLLNDRVTVAQPPPHPPLASHCRVQLVLPDGTAHLATGPVVAQGPHGFDVRLALTADITWALSRAVTADGE